MVLVTSSPLPEIACVVEWQPFVDAFRTIEATGQFPFLVIRFCDLGTIAWEHGRRRARRQEEFGTRALEAAANELLRAGDMIAHRAGTEWYLVALRMPTRKGASAMPADARVTLARLEGVLVQRTGLRLETGWTLADVPASGEDLATLAQEALERGRRERERYAFFSVVGHELRTPLTSIRGYLETVLDGALDAATTRRFLEIAYAETLRVGRLVEGLFDISLLDLRTRARHDEVCSVQAAVAAAFEAMQPLCERSGVTLVTRVSGDDHVTMLEGSLTQIIVNLIENAIKYGRPRGTIVVSSVVIEDRTFELRVDDDGPGFDVEQAESFFHIGERGASSQAGSGIGLALVRLFAERAGGEAGAGAGDLGGARFFVRLPLHVER